MPDINISSNPSNTRRIKGFMPSGYQIVIDLDDHKGTKHPFVITGYKPSEMLYFGRMINKSEISNPDYREETERFLKQSLSPIQDGIKSLEHSLGILEVHPDSDYDFLTQHFNIGPRGSSLFYNRSTMGLSGLDNLPFEDVLINDLRETNQQFSELYKQVIDELNSRRG
ncbi:hypothetical protein H6503_05990 [Candidatus Woesearchaeota archaeon]|nr:hypothetical protein [Candidatus Woesearchaeota archaeon]